MSGIPLHVIYWLLGAAVSVIGTLLGLFMKQLMAAFTKAFATLSRLEQITSVQAENHLTTIQAEAIKQTALIGNMIKEQAETNGYLKAVVDMTKPQ